MKTSPFLVFLLLMIFSSSSICFPQTPKSDPEFTAFLTKFRAAISGNDKAAVASMTKLPFLYENKERNREEFIRIYSELFTPKIRRCLATAKPLKEGENYDLFCGQLIFYLGKDSGEYKLLEFGVND